MIELNFWTIILLSAAVLILLANIYQIVSAYNKKGKAEQDLRAIENKIKGRIKGQKK